MTAAGYRSRTGIGLVGQPDLVFAGKRTVVLLDGCFWHGCPEHRGVPTRSGEFWRTKIQRNKARDIAVTAALSRDGWRVIRVWEHDVKTRDAAARKAEELAAVLETA
ncbi:MAG: very short patch repair endonuclease [Armatimonadetes bacterium]|nr:very short patch repair endonuclease [Armatimonadota bacterium]